MKIKTFKVPVLDPLPAEEELNGFLSSHRVDAVDKQLVQLGQNAWWSFVVTYLDGHRDQTGSGPKRPSVDYKEVLNENDFSRYAKLRELRNTLAKQEGRPAYAIFTNEQLARLVTEQVTSKEAMAAIDGIGEARIERYADAFLSLLIGFESGDKA